MNDVTVSQRHSLPTMPRSKCGRKARLVRPYEAKGGEAAPASQQEAEAAGEAVSWRAQRWGEAAAEGAAEATRSGARAACLPAAATQSQLSTLLCLQNPRR